MFDINGIKLRRRYFFQISYKGTAYHGWQKQAGANTVQETIEQALHKILKKEVHIVGCGRTDTGVHASQYYFHLNTEHEMNADMLFVLNKELPDDISVHKILEVNPDIHAQFSAVQRTYTYRVHTVKDPFLSDLSAYYQLDNFNIAEVIKAVNLLNGEWDFRSFCVTPARHSNTVCRIHKAIFIEDESTNGFMFRITGDHFLRGMVRIITGKLIEIGSGRMTVAEFRHHLEKGERFKFLNQAYPQGLYLSQIKYSSVPE